MAKAQKRFKKRHKQPYGDLVEINTSRVLVNMVEEGALTNIAEDFLGLLGTSAAIYEKNGDYALRAIDSDWCRFLDQASRKLCGTDDNRRALESGKWHCHESHWNLASKVSIETGRPVDIKCMGGIHIYAIPIWAGGEIVGSINVGYGEPPQDPRKLRKIAARYSVSIEKLREQTKSYRTRPAQVIDTAKTHLATSAKLIGAIAECKRIQQAMFESKENFRQLFENIEDAIFWADPKTGYIINCNKAAETLLERKRGEIIGQPQTMIHPPQKIEYYAKMFRAYVEERLPPPEAEVITKSGKTKFVYITASTILANGEPIVQGVFREITERKRMEEELRRHSERLEDLVKERIKKRLEAERMTAIGEIAGVVGYDLRNSLQIITDAVQSAKEKMDSASSLHRNYAKLDAWKLLERIEEQTDYIQRIVSDLYDYTKPVKPRLEEVGLSQLLQNTLPTMRVPETVKISIEIEKGFPKLTVDTEMMKRVFTNMITNAVQAMPKGGVITIEASQREGAAYVTVRDTGVGVPEEILDKLFLPLFTTKPKGTGFGLPICKRLVENHDGTITVESKLNKGTAFTVSIPLRKSRI